MEVKMLMENTAHNNELHIEHGLSIYIETKKHKVLFDAGQSDALVENAEQMGVDLSQVDIAILSHGHYDHSGGWERFFQINQKAKLYINEHAFGAFYSGTEKKIGVPQFLHNHSRVIVTSDYKKLDEELELITCNAFHRKYQSDSTNLFVKIGDELQVDTFLHEQYLLIKEDDKEVLISGCSHKGIQNIAEWFRTDVLIGGFHFKGIAMDAEGKEKLENHAKQLTAYNTRYYTCHCTGVEQYMYLKEKMQDSVEYLATGDAIEI